MAVRLDRRAVIMPGKRTEAAAFAAEITQYVRDNWGVNINWGMEIGGTWGAVHWFADYDNLAHLEETFAKTMSDPGYVALIDRSSDLFEGAEDLLTMMM